MNTLTESTPPVQKRGRGRPKGSRSGKYPERLNVWMSTKMLAEVRSLAKENRESCGALVRQFVRAALRGWRV